MVSLWRNGGLNSIDHEVVDHHSPVASSLSTCSGWLASSSLQSKSRKPILIPKNGTIYCKKLLQGSTWESYELAFARCHLTEFTQAWAIIPPYCQINVVKNIKRVFFDSSIFYTNFPAHWIHRGHQGGKINYLLITFLVWNVWITRIIGRQLQPKRLLLTDHLSQSCSSFVRLVNNLKISM